MKKTRSFRMAVGLILSVLLVFGLTACSGVTEPGGDPNTPTVTAVSIVGGNLEKEFGSSDFTLVASVTVTGDAARTVTWGSSNENVATVQANSGLVHLTGVGQTTITATSTVDTTKSASVQLEVYRTFIPENGGMENDLPVWGSYPATAAAVSTDRAYEGTRSLKASSSVYSVAWAGINVADARLGGEYVSLGAWVYRPADTCGDIKVRLLLEGFVSDTNKPILVQSEQVETATDEWVYVQTGTTQIPLDMTIVNAKVEFHGTGETVYVDNVNIEREESNNVKLSGVYFDGEPFGAYSNSIDTYSAIYTGQLPEVEVSVLDENTTAVVTQPTEENKTCTIAITAKDGTTRTVTITFSEVSDSALRSLSVNGTAIAHFDPLRKDYYVSLPAGTTQVPEVTAEAYFDDSAQVAVTNATDLSALNSSVAVVTVTGEKTNSTYTVQFQAVTDKEIIMHTIDTTFDGDTLVAGAKWGTAKTTFVSDKGNSGNGSARIEAGGNMWGSGDENPTTGIEISFGVWVYIEGEEAEGEVEISVNARNAASEKIKDADLTSIKHTVTADDLNKWIWIQTPVSSGMGGVPASTFYLQFLVYNKTTGSNVYMDDLHLYNEGPAEGTVLPSSPDEVPAGFTLSNAITDMSFEAMQVGDNFASAWGNTYVVTDEKAQNGTKSIKTTAAPNYSGMKFALTVGEDLQEGDALIFGAWVYIESASSCKTVLIKLEYSGKGYKTHSTTVETGKWVFVKTAEITVENAGEDLLLCIANEDGGATEGDTITYYVDNVKLFVKAAA